MNNEDRILKGLTEVYKQNQAIITELKMIKASIGVIEPTHLDPQKPTITGGKPWDAWKGKPEQTANIEGEPIPNEAIPEGFKL